jgi:tRNA(Ile)-lysidine synthase
MAFALRWLEEYGFPWNLAYDYLQSETTYGNPLHYGSWTLSRTRNGLLLHQITSAEIISIEHPGEFEYENGMVRVSLSNVTNPALESAPDKQFLAKEAVRFPLTIRPVMPGDIFQPIGMEGKSKKLQDLLTDLKLSWDEKRTVRVLTNPDHILWVIGIRLDHRARVRNTAEAVVEISFGEKRI